jgi:catechol 2,3-dioxygenase-like lactoylglutathione lyase family enzyme
MIRKLHHNAYRCRDSEETRRFYEDFLGLPLVQAFEIGRTKTGRETHALHTFYRLDDGSHLAFFEAPDMPFEFKPQHDFDLHIALEVGRRRAAADDGEGEGAGARMPRPVGPRDDRLDLLPRPERLRDRALRQAARARCADGPGGERARAPRSSAGRRARPRNPPERGASRAGVGGIIGRARIRPLEQP